MSRKNDAKAVRRNGASRWTFTEAQRPAVCAGDLCPACLGRNVRSIGSAPCLTRANMQFRCEDCREEWEGN